MPAEEDIERGEGQERHDGGDSMIGAVEDKPIRTGIETKAEGKETKPPLGKASGGKKKKGKR